MPWSHACVPLFFWCFNAHWRIDVYLYAMYRHPWHESDVVVHALSNQLLARPSHASFKSTMHHHVYINLIIVVASCAISKSPLVAAISHGITLIACFHVHRALHPNAKHAFETSLLAAIVPYSCPRPVLVQHQAMALHLWLVYLMHKALCHYAKYKSSI